MGEKSYRPNIFKFYLCPYYNGGCARASNICYPMTHKHSGCKGCAQKPRPEVEKK